MVLAPTPVASPAQRPYVPSMAVGDAVPEIALIDQFGRAISFRRHATPSIVSFAYTRCPDDRGCALVTAKFARLQAALRGTGIRLVEVTLDPEVDRPAVLRRYAQRAGARAGAWAFATGNPADVVALAERFGIVRERRPGGELQHTDIVAIVSGAGVLDELIGGSDWSPNDLAAEARHDAGLDANPAARLALQLFASASAVCGGRGGGIPLAGAIATFAFLTALLSALAARTFAAALFDWS